MKNNRSRCHFSIIFESMWQFWAVIIFIVINQIETLREVIRALSESGIESNDGLIGALIGLGVILLISIIVLLIQFLRWRKTWITLEDNLIIIERNTINRKKNTIAIENISSVNTEQNIFERLVGTCKIKIDTNSLTTANTADVIIVFEKRKAESFRTEVMEKVKALKNGETADARKWSTQEGLWQASQNPFSNDADEHIEHFRNIQGLQDGQPLIVDRISYAGNIYGSLSENNVKVYQYTSKDLLAHWLYTMPVSSLLVILAGAVASAWGIMQYGLDGYLSFIVDGALATAILVITVGYNVVKQFIVYYGLKVYRIKKDIYLSYGLIKKQSYILPVDKIACIKINQPFISRLCKKYYAEVHTVGFDDKSGGMANISLAMDKAPMLGILKVLVPEYATDEVIEDIIKQDKSVRIINFVGWVMWSVPIIACGFCVVWLLETPKYLTAMGVCAAVIFVALLYILGYKTKGYKLQDRLGIFVDGHFAKRYAIVRYDNIQYVTYRENPISAQFAQRSANVFLLNKTVEMPYAPRTVGVKLSDLIFQKNA